MQTLSLPFLLLLAAAAFISHEVSADDPFPLPSHRALVAPLTKHTQTNSLYSITLNSQQHSLIDLDSPFSWYHCTTHHNAVPCRIPPCQQARSYSFTSPSCPNPKNLSTKFGCSICLVTPVNPISKACAISQFAFESVSIDWTDGSNPTSTMNNLQVGLSCAPQSLLKSLPKNVTGVLALSRSPLALSSQFAHSFLGLANKFAICLSSWSLSPGVIFFGEGPYNLSLSDPNDVDLSDLLSYTPLLENAKSPGYYIGLKSISVSGNTIPIPTSLGNNSVKLSTIVPYTTLRSDVYNLFVSSFSNATKDIPRVAAVKPFSLCFKASAIGGSRIGYSVAPIDLEMQSGMNWTIYGTNSIEKVGDDVACLAFVDGGKTTENAVVIGSFQMEDYFLLFDLENSRLGFSTGLLYSRLPCGNFNFTTNSGS